MAQLGGVGRKSQGAYEGGDRTPDAAYLAALDEHGVDVLYVITGRRESARAERAVQAMAGMLQMQEPAPDAVPLADLRGRAGGVDAPLRLRLRTDDGLRDYVVLPEVVGPRDLGAARPVGSLALDAGTIHALLGGDKGMVALRTYDDALSGTIAPGDVVVLDTRVDRIGDSGIYALGSRANFFLRRVVRHSDERLSVKTDRVDETEVYSGDRAPPNVVGRVVWPRVR